MLPGSNRFHKLLSSHLTNIGEKYFAHFKYVCVCLLKFDQQKPEITEAQNSSNMAHANEVFSSSRKYLNSSQSLPQSVNCEIQSISLRWFSLETKDIWMNTLRFIPVWNSNFGLQSISCCSGSKTTRNSLIKYHSHTDIRCSKCGKNKAYSKCNEIHGNSFFIAIGIFGI